LPDVGVPLIGETEYIPYATPYRAAGAEDRWPGRRSKTIRLQETARLQGFLAHPRRGVPHRVHQFWMTPEEIRRSDSTARFVRVSRGSYRLKDRPAPPPTSLTFHCGPLQIMSPFDDIPLCRRSLTFKLVVVR
jgi:hypothetical protein